jgi:hypothetical protein
MNFAIGLKQAGISGRAPALLTGTTGCANWHTSSAADGQALGGTAGASRRILRVVHAYIANARTWTADLEQALAWGLAVKTTETVRRNNATRTTWC